MQWMIKAICNLLRWGSILLTWVSVFRVPLLTLVLLAALPWICLSAAPTLLENLVRELQPMDVMWSSLVTLLVALAAVTEAKLLLLYGDRRLNTRHLHLARYSGFPVIVIGIAACIPLLRAVSRESTAPGAATWYALGGAALALTLAGAAKALQHRCPRLPQSRLRDWVRRIPRWLGAGYIDYVNGQFLPGHIFALSLAVGSLIVYATAGAWKAQRLGEPAVFPTLAFVLLLVLLAAWVLSALTFFLDRYRFPTLAAFVLLSLLTAQDPRTDHFFPVASSNVERLTPTEALMQPGLSNVLVVSAEGGGIQAAGWTTRVLAGLEEALPGGTFGRSVRLISGVSGGSVGTMYYANAVGKQQPPGREVLEEAVKASMASSLDDVAWGLSTPDLLRIVFPVWNDRFLDRGWALETAWESRAGLGEVMLSSWAENARQGRQPPVIFNSTVVEVGQPLVFSTTKYPGEGSDQILTLAQVASGANDIQVGTAARLSASFPYVSPAARPALNDGKPAMHMVDGGYYDNFGMFSLMGWLEEALEGRPANAPPIRVLVMEILPFPDAASPPVPERGWSYQLWAPAEAVLNVRTSAQRARNDDQYLFFARSWNERKDRGVRIERLIVQFPKQTDALCRDNQPPLSWRLREEQKECIERAWRAVGPAAASRVKSFLEGNF